MDSELLKKARVTFARDIRRSHGIYAVRSNTAINTTRKAANFIT